jgi:hypothetical protein
MGCGDSDQIRRYRAPKAAQVDLLVEQPAAHSPLDTSSPQRMLGAVIPIEGYAWFFRINGDTQQLQQHVEPFKEWVASIRFEGDKPTWKLPDQWRRKPASGMRFATILPDPEEDDLELTVIPLPLEGDPKQSILANINRWRGQLGLKPIGEEQLSETTESIPLDGLTATFVDLASDSKTSQDREESAGQLVPMSGPEASSGDPAGIRFETPDGWNPAPLTVSRGGITIRHEAAFEIASDGQRLEFTLDRLPSGPLLQNVNRWRGQIGLQPVNADELPEIVRKLEVGGMEADLVELVGEEESILGVIAEQGTQTWYFKLKGNKELAAREKENFLSLARSVSFP